MRWQTTPAATATKKDLSSFDTGNVANMFGMFSGCSSLPGLDLSSFDTRNVERMYRMFFGCSSLSEITVRAYDDETGSGWTTVKAQQHQQCGEMFGNCGTDHVTVKTE